MCVLIFSTIFVWNISHSVRNWARYDQKCVVVFIQSTRYSYQILMKLEFSWEIFKKYINIKFHENPSSGSWVPCRQTDRQTHLLGVFVVLIRSLRLNRCVLLCWMQCQCMGSSVWLETSRLQFVLLSIFLIVIQSFINLWLLMVLISLLGRHLQFYIRGCYFMWVYSLSCVS